MVAPARYFPVVPGPLRMQPGLLRFGSDLGNGTRDAAFFQRDDERDRYLRAKRATPPDRHVIAGDDDAARSAREAALAWMRETLAREEPAMLEEAEADRTARDELEAIAFAVQEDFAIVALAGSGDPLDGRAVALDVRFPSGWRPEVLGGASFAGIHRPVPGFAKVDAAARSMVSSMVGRGPYVRFVWTVSADDVLDHHPDADGRRGWEDAERAWLRVERQITVPIASGAASLFLIRTYAYPVESLEPAQRVVLREAIRAMPSELRAYKSLPTAEQFERVTERT